MHGLLLSDIISVEVTIVLCENRGEMRFMHDLMSVLQSVSVLNRDNGFSFTNTERLDATEEGWVTEADFTIEKVFIYALYRSIGKAADKSLPLLLIAA